MPQAREEEVRLRAEALEQEAWEKRYPIQAWRRSSYRYSYSCSYGYSVGFG